MTKEEYRGYKEATVVGDDINSFFSGEGAQTYGCLQNEYILAKDEEGNDLGIYKFDGSQFRKIPFKVINTMFCGKVKARNVQQQMAIDMLYDANTTVNILTGCFGSGKDHLMCSAAIDLVEHNKFEKIVYVRNNIEVKNTKPIGFLPGTYEEKLLPYVMPLADKLGGVDGLSLMMNQGKIEAVHLGLIRGRDIKNSIIYCSEAENMTKEHVQLLLGRVGEGSVLWLNGDFRQCDAEVFVRNSGLARAIDALKGNPLFAYIQLQKTERSATAALADLLD